MSAQPSSTRGGSSVLVSLLEAEKVPFETLREKYGALLALADTLLGVVPNCDPYLEIWPTAFRSYNTMFPNLVNLPLVLWGLGAPRASVGLAMYVSSRSAGCAYCSAHTCTFALRRGASVDEVAAALEGEHEGLSPANRAAVRVAHALAVVPAEIIHDDRKALRAHFSAAHEEWIVLSIAMMGWLNKTMDALGVPLEESTVAEVREVMARSGWTPGKHMAALPPADIAPPRADSFATKAGVLRHAPSAVALDRRWTRGVPDRAPAVGAFLRAEVGHEFPVLARLRHRRAVRAIAMMLRDNLAKTAPSVVGRGTKLGAALLFAETAENQQLAGELRACGAEELASDTAAHTLARAIATSPTKVDAAVVEACRELTPPAIVELVTCVSLAQLLHRLEAYFGA